MNLITRSDFDGLVCGAILEEAGIIDNWTFVHPKDLQDGLIPVTENDVLANVPYVPGCGLWFDHHSSEEDRIKGLVFKGESRLERSTTRIIYEYYGGKEKMPHFEEMINAVDLVDSGQLSVDDILNPRGWVLLGFIMDPRTGLGRFQDYTISNYALMKNLIEECRTKKIDEILANPHVQERLKRYWEQDELFRQMIKEHTQIHGNVIFTDLRDVSPIYSGNRFMIYAIYPEQNISVWVVDGRAKKNAAIAIGHSIINRTSKTDVGALCLKNGGGGHKQVGTCQVPYEDCDKILKACIEQMNAEG